MIRSLALAATMIAVLILAMTGTAAASHYDRLLAPSTKCANQTNTRLSAADQERVMRCMHNYARARVGRAPLRDVSLLATSSDRKTGDLIACGFSHNACGRSMSYWMSRVGYLSCSSWRAGENIAWGTGSLGTVRSIMRGWLHSDGHRDNLLSSRYRDAGFGLRKGTMAGHSGASVWTTQLGYRSGC
jgi:uncharacterized protein YkwD